ncbi:MAG: hypothetical protein FWF12_00610 [Betaproteobacteria bacterium]|nr:hypothetical protein [Betaproteobacteria bacterium]
MMDKVWVAKVALKACLLGVLVWIAWLMSQTDASASVSVTGYLILIVIPVFLGYLVGLVDGDGYCEKCPRDFDCKEKQ